MEKFVQIFLYAFTISIISMNAQAENIYQKISDLYSAGSLIDLAAFDGKTVSGRCFTYSKPNDPKPSFVAIQKSVPDIGPIANPIDRFFIESWYHPSRPANTYDHMTWAEIERLEHLQSWIEPKKYDPVTYMIEHKDGSSSFYRYSTETGYILKKITDRTNVGDLMCYYFMQTLN